MARRWLCALALVTACGGKEVVSGPAPADLVLVNGTVITMDPLRPRAEGLAISGGRVEAVGSAAEMRRHVGSRTRVVDLGGRAVTPGLVDGHCHLYNLGRALDEVDLRGAASPEAAAAEIAEAAKGRPAGEWILGRGWDQNLWPGQAFPGHAVLDAVVSDRPVAVDRVDGHALWVNAAGLRAAGITRATADPPGGKILRDVNGEPTGVFIDNAAALVESKIPKDPQETRRRRILAAQEVALSHGITGVHEMGIDDDTVAVYRELAAAGKLRLRVHALLSGAGRMDSLPGRKPDVDRDGTAMFVLRGVKLFADGALGSRGATLLEPYSDDPGNRGLVLTDRAELERSAKLALAGGWQLAVHAIGDQANRDVLDAFAAAGVKPEHRFRIEHAQIVAPADIPRFAAQGVIASMQPTHATSDMPWAEARVGRARLAGAYAWRSMLDARATLLGGSDFPVEEVPIMNGIAAAVSRQDPSGKPEGGWLPEQRLTLEEALRMFTVAPAFASFRERHHGRIAPGFVADLTVYDADLVEDAAALYRTRIDLTIVGGQVVFERKR